jgi:Na+/phosphate symporter
MKKGLILIVTAALPNPTCWLEALSIPSLNSTDLYKLSFCLSVNALSKIKEENYMPIIILDLYQDEYLHGMQKAINLADTIKNIMRAKKEEDKYQQSIIAVANKEISAADKTRLKNYFDYCLDNINTQGVIEKITEIINRHETNEIEAIVSR